MTATNTSIAPLVSRRTLLGLLGASVVGAAGYGLFRTVGAAQAGFTNVNDYVFVLDAESARVTLVDLSTDRVAGTVEFPAKVDAFAVSREIDQIYATNQADRMLYGFDLATGSVVTEIALPLEPTTILLSPDGLTLAIADGDSRLAIVDLVEAEIRGIVEDLSPAGNLAYSNDSTNIFIPNDVDGRIEVVDTTLVVHLDPIDLTIGKGGTLSALTRTPNGLYGTVVDQEPGKLALINFRNWQEVEVMDVGPEATRAYGTADGQYMMVVSEGTGVLSVFSTLYFEIEAEFSVPKDVVSIATGFFETHAMITSASENKSVIIDLEKMEPAGEVNYSGTPGPAIVDPDGRRMYVPIEDTGELVVVDVFKKEIVSTIRGIGGRPTQVALSATNNYCH